MIEKDELVTAKSISATIGISLRKVEKNIRKLKKMERIKRVGSDSTKCFSIFLSALVSEPALSLPKCGYKILPMAKKIKHVQLRERYTALRMW